MTDDEIRSMKKDTFKNYIRRKVDKVGLEYLQNLAEKHSKSKFTLDQTKLEKQEYLSDGRFSKSESQLLFSIRSRMLPLKNNFKNLHNNNMKCLTCEDELSLEDENHILKCETLKTEDSVKI